LQVRQALEQLLDAAPASAATALLHAIGARLSQAHANRTAGAPHWWRLREAACLALELGASHLAQANKKALSNGRAAVFSAAHAFEELWGHDLTNPDTPPLLRARALCAAARYAASLPREALAKLVGAIRAALEPQWGTQLRLVACGALMGSDCD
jgi:hypothetical protein